MKKVVCLVILLVGVVFPLSATAESDNGCVESDYDRLEEDEGKMRRYAEDNILYYSEYDNGNGCAENGPSPEPDNEEGGGDVIECSADGMTNYAGEQILSGAFIDAIKENYPYYKAAADKVGIPWQALAAIHYRETRFARTSNAYQITGGGGGDFAAQTDAAAAFLKGKGSFESDDAAKRAFFGYNGMSSAYKQQAINLGFSEAAANNGEGSPYVMNKYDEKRDPNKNGSSWGQIKSDGGGIVYPANQDFGAFVVYKALMNCEIVSGGGDGEAPEPGSYSEAINQMALKLAWPDRSHDISDPKPEYLSVIQKLGYTTSKDVNVQRGSSCDVFVAAVLSESGADPEIVGKGLGAANQRNYLSSSSKWKEVPLSEAAPGDIRTIQYTGKEEHGNHIEVVVMQNGTMKVASASYGDRTAGLGNYYSGKSGVNIRVFRRI